MKQIKNRYYFSVNECLNGEVNGQSWKAFDYMNTGIFANLDVEYQAWEWAELVAGTNPDAIAKKFFTEYLSLKANDICFASDHEELAEDNKLNPDYRRFLARFLNWWKSTFDKYSQLIGYYEDSEGKLMSGVLSTTDTTTDNTNTSVESAVPSVSTYQSYPSNTDDVAAGSHDKQHGTIKITADVASEDLIDHLDKLKAKIENLYSEWLQSFEERFILYIGD